MLTRRQRFRTLSVGACFLILFLALSLRVGIVQLIQAPRLKLLADRQHHIRLPLPARRGSILDRHGRPLAHTVTVYSVFADARRVLDKRQSAQLLSKVLELDAEWLLERLSRDKSFVWLKRKLPESDARRLRDLKIPYIHLIPEHQRVYPGQQLAAHILGFCNIDNVGLEGLEAVYQRSLRGEDGWHRLQRDARGRSLSGWEDETIPPRDGHHLVLTLDQTIQHMAERHLEEAMQKTRAQHGMVLVMDPWDGSVLALAIRPSFDPNQAGHSTVDARRNVAVTDYFEPGSVFKVVTAAALLNEGKVRLTDRFFCENGSYYVGGRVLHDHRGHGWLTFEDVISLSSNIGTVKAAAALSPEIFYQYICNFGFGQVSGLGLPGEVAGVIRPPKMWSGTSMSNLPMGQEVGVNSVQLTGMVSAVANGGFLIQPRVVDRIVDTHGVVIQESPPRVRRRIIREETAGQMRRILAKVVSEGTARTAQPEPPYQAGGKTGTAQKIDPQTRRYSHDKFVASFVGFAPVDAPRLTIAVILDEPRGSYYGGVVCTPVFKKVATEALRYLEYLDASRTQIAS